MGLRYIVTFFAAALAVSACSKGARTEVLIVADSDLMIPSQIDRIDFEVVGPLGDAQTAGADIRGAVDLPAVLGLVHEGGDLGVFQVNAVASIGGVQTLSRTQRFTFVESETLVLRIDLLRRCIGASCATGETCGAEGCRPIDVAGSELEPWTGSPPRIDGGPVPDGGTDGGTDADTGVVDAGCVTDPQCDDLVACTVDRCVGGACQNTPDDSVCTTGDVCDLTAGCSGRPCDDNADCDDGAFCNGTEACVAMRCTTGASPSCNDGIACTADRCDDVMAACVNTPDDAMCDDAIACTADSCVAAVGCMNAPLDAMCDDTFACTTDACVPGTGCVQTPNDGTCALGELCTPGTGCTAGPTFTQIFTDTLNNDCAPCHTRGAPAADLDYGTQMTAYTDLVGVAAQCGVGNVRVVPRDAATSLLWRKVAGVDLCGSRMPNGRMPIPDAEIDQIRDWINAGALNN